MNSSPLVQLLAIAAVATLAIATPITGPDAVASAGAPTPSHLSDLSKSIQVSNEEPTIIYGTVLSDEEAAARRAEYNNLNSTATFVQLVPDEPDLHVNKRRAEGVDPIVNPGAGSSSGGFINTCRFCFAHGDRTFECDCRTEAGNYIISWMPLGDVLENRNGVLRWAYLGGMHLTCGPVQTATTPGYTYVTQCRNVNQQYLWTSIDLSEYRA